jgi:hypothetical protein
MGPGTRPAARPDLDRISTGCVHHRSGHGMEFESGQKDNNEADLSHG